MRSEHSQPYIVRTHVPGREELSAEDLAAVWTRLLEEGIADSLFYDGGISSAAAFVRFMTGSRVFCYVLERTEDGLPLALSWLNNCMGRAAMVHFAVLRAGLPSKVEIGRHMVGFFLHAQQQGAYCLDALYGMTPAPYAHVLRYVRRLGFRMQGTLPAALYMASQGRAGGACFVDAVLSVCTRESLAAGSARPG